jgi:hypothetical protein
LNELRGQVKGVLEGLAPEALDWQPIQGEGELATNSLTVLATHLAGSETYWIREVVARQPIQRNRDAEFLTKKVGPSDLKARLDSAAAATAEVLSALKEGQMEEERNHRGRKVTVRWSILHVFEHTALHLGHMQLTRQLWLARSRK